MELKETIFCVHVCFSLNLSFSMSLVFQLFCSANVMKGSWIRIFNL